MSLRRRDLLIATPAGVALTAAAPPASYAVFQSRDRGRSWSRSDQGLPGDSRVNAFGHAGEAVLLAGTDAGVFVSRDQGGNWVRAKGGRARILSFAAARTSLFAGTDSSLLVSQDGGMSWTAAPGFPSKKVRCLLSDGGAVYAGTDADQVWKLSNGDEPTSAWRHLADGLPAQAQIFAMAAADGRVFAGLYGKGLFAWNQLQERWARVGAVMPLALAATAAGRGRTLIAGHNPGGILWSDDQGANWKQGKFGDLASDAPVWELAAGGELMLAGAADGIFYSEDRGRNWTRAQAGLSMASAGVALMVRGSFALAGTVMRNA